MKKETKLYKILNGTQAKDGGSFDYKKYLPKGNKKGKWLPKIKNLQMCEKGYHITNNYTQWLNGGTAVYEVETKDAISKGSDKFVCETFRFLKLVNTNVGKENVGLCNSGDRNSGNNNSGDWNSGYNNSGDWNSGNNNTGYNNSGDCNSGYNNSGDCNSGNNNTGNNNTGYNNSGNRNSGYWNTGNNNTGYFNADTPPTRIFGKETKQQTFNFPSWLYFHLTEWIEVSEMSKEEKKEFWWYETTKGYLRTQTYKEAFKKAFDNATIDGVKDLLKLPNFNHEVFEKISGISKEEIKDKIKKVKAK